MSGFYLMHRGWQDHSIFRNEAFSRRDAFVWMIEEAAFQDGEVWIGGTMLRLKRGQFSHSLRFMAKAWKWDEAKVRRFLKSTQEAKIIDASTDAGQTVITICNYDKYQTVSPQDDAPIDAAATQQRRGSDAKNKEGKELKKIEDRLGQSNPRARSPNGDAPPSPFELQARQIADVIRLTRPISQVDREQLRGWLRDGLHFEFHVVEAAKQIAARELGRGRAISGFRYLDGAVREYAAAWHADRERYEEISAGGSR